MILILISLICSYICSNIGFMLGGQAGDFTYVLYGVIGFLLPSIYLIEKIYMKSRRD